MAAERREHRHSSRTPRSGSDCAYCYGKELTISQLDAELAAARAHIALLQRSAD